MSDWGRVIYNKQRDQWAVEGVWQGKRVYVSQYPSRIGLITCDSKQMAARLKDAINSDIDKGIFDPKRYKHTKPLHVVKYAETWLKLKKEEVSAATHHDYTNSLKNHIIPGIGDKFLPDISHDDLKELLHSIQRGPKGKKNVMDCLKNMMKDAHLSGHIPVMPPWIKFQGKNKITRPPVRSMPVADQLLILAKIPLNHRPIFMFMMATGCRPSEARAFRKQDIGQTNIMFVKSFGRGEQLKNVKAEEAKPFPLTAEVVEILSMAPKNLTTFVFPNPDTSRPYTKNINRIWNAACDAAEVPRVNLYNSTRHSFACQMLNGGIDKGQVSKLLRHSDPKMIERYADYEMETLRKSVDNVRMVNFKKEKAK